MDASWMSKSRASTTYIKGLDKFLVHIFSTESVNGKISCPCIKCATLCWVGLEDARTHLLCDGFIKGYTITPTVNEPGDTHMLDTEDDMLGLVHDAFHGFNDNSHEHEEQPSKPNRDAKKFFKRLDAAKKELYPGCKKFSVLSFIVRLFHSKCVGKCNDKGFSMMLDTIREAFPEASIPKSYYEVRKIIRELGLGYEKIDACPNDCMLYWKDNIVKTECDICHTSRYKTSEDDSEDEDAKHENVRKIGAKILRYFPIIPRLQRLYMSSESAAPMRWHDEGRTKDGLLRHPADSPAWQTFDHHYPDFAKESRNVRLGLASDGFNPFGNMTLSHSTWPVVLVPYNLPPWLCMKKPYFILSLLIPGPSQPGNNIDVYLQPLVEELKELWDVNGIETYDSSRKSNFQMRACLLWTISDFPAYANLSGWSTKGQFACPCCHKDTNSRWLENGKKFCFMGHRRYLPMNHAYRTDTRSFDGTEELNVKPRSLSGSEVLEQLSGYENKFGKSVRVKEYMPFSWKKRSIFFELPYWKNNLIRHNLDVMHIEKNVCDSLFGTIMNLEGKNKDHLNARNDLAKMKIRSVLHPIPLDNNKWYLPPACFSMKKDEKDLVFQILKGVKVPDGYSSNISRCVQLKPPKMVGLKSHDSHILMQQLYPIAIRNVLPKHVRSVVLKLCLYYRQLCGRVLDPVELVTMENEIGIILCELERIFPPSFFDIMVHLSVHLASEARLGGNVTYRWMYPVERYLATLKSYVRNKSRPEGSIAEGYLAEECVSFCSSYLSDDVETIHNKTSRNYDDGGNEYVLPIFSMPGRPIGARHTERLTLDTLSKAHSYVLFNCSALEPFRTEHLEILRRENRKSKHVIHRLHSGTFESWFQDHVTKLNKQGDHRITEDVRDMAIGPSEYASKYKGYIVNGYRFHTKDVEKKRKTQNSGVMLEAMTSSFSSVRDNNPIDGDVTYFGVLRDIIELQYTTKKKVVLFRCDWISNGSRKKEDENGFTSVNFSGTLKCDKEPFILASQAQQVFYVKDPVDKGWKVVVKTKARDSYDMNDEQTSVDDLETHLQSEIFMDPKIDENNNIDLVRGDTDGIVVENDTINPDRNESQAGEAE